MRTSIAFNLKRIQRQWHSISLSLELQDQSENVGSAGAYVCPCVHTPWCVCVCMCASMYASMSIKRSYRYRRCSSKLILTSKSRPLSEHVGDRHRANVVYRFSISGKPCGRDDDEDEDEDNCVAPRWWCRAVLDKLV